MELKAGHSAIVTGGAAGIGRALVLALAQKGTFITIIDFSEDKGREVASLAEGEVRKIHGGLKFPPVLFFRCDVADSSKSEMREFCDFMFVNFWRVEMFD